VNQTASGTFSHRDTNIGTSRCGPLPPPKYLVSLRDFRLPLWCKCERASSGILSSVKWVLLTDVSGKIIDHIFKGQAIKEECRTPIPYTPASLTVPGIFRGLIET